MKAHRDILNALYHVSPTFVGNTDWTPEAKHYCELLCMTADFYSCQQILDLHIDNYLRQQSESILMDFEEAPVQMLSFGLNIKSSFVTKEACVHIIGENVKSYAAMRSELVGLEMAELINEKRTALAEQLRAVDFELLRLQLFISPNNERDHRARQIAVNVFRQHITNRLDMGQLSELGTNFAVPYREIARGAIPDDVHIAETHCPPSSHVKALRFGFQIAMRELVDEAKEIVDPVLQDVTQLKGGYNVDGKLLCMGISDEELPWVAKKD